MTTSVDCVDDSKTSLSGETLCDGAHTQSYLDDYSDRPHTRRSKSIWSEVVFVVSISISRSLCGYSLIGFPTLLPTLVDKFHLEGTSRIWLASIFPLVLSAFLIPFRRLADRFGVLLVFHLGLAWTLIWTLFAGISTNGSMLIACRAMQGLGGAAHFLSGATILSGIYSPGSRRDRVFFLYESMELLGSFLGILVAGLVSQYLSWRWYFWVAAILALQALVGSALTVPESAKSFSQRAKVPMDWLGCFTTASALILTACWIIEFPDAPQGWRTPYLLATEVLSIVSLGLAVYVEGWIAEKPLLPLRILETSRVGPLLVGLFFGYGAVGLYLLYAIL
jgi:MFS family permease